jgi:hypothetical protein
LKNFKISRTERIKTRHSTNKKNFEKFSQFAISNLKLYTHPKKAKNFSLFNYFGKEQGK